LSLCHLALVEIVYKLNKEDAICNENKSNINEWSKFRKNVTYIEAYLCMLIKEIIMFVLNRLFLEVIKSLKKTQILNWGWGTIKLSKTTFKYMQNIKWKKPLGKK